MANVAWAISDLRLKEAFCNLAAILHHYIFFVAKNVVPSPILVRLNILKSISVDSGPYHTCVLYRRLLRITLYNIVSIITSFTNLTSRYPSSIRNKLDSLYMTSIFARWGYQRKEHPTMIRQTL